MSEQPRKSDVACGNCEGRSFYLVTNLTRAVVLRCNCCPRVVEADSIDDAVKKIQGPRTPKEQGNGLAETEA